MCLCMYVSVCVCVYVFLTLIYIYISNAHETKYKTTNLVCNLISGETNFGNMFTPLESVNFYQNTTNFEVFPIGPIFWLIIKSLFGMYLAINLESVGDIL